MGTAGILIGKDPVAREEIFDLCHEAVEYYQVLQNNKLEFWYEFSRIYPKLLKYQKKYFEEMKVMIDLEPNMVRRAVYFYLLTKHCFNGIWRRAKGTRKINCSWGKQIKGRGIFTPNWLDQVCERIENVRFRRQECSQTLANLNAEGSPNAFCLLDPPYLECSTTYDGESFTREDFMELKNQIESAPYKWMLTVNEHDFLRELFQDFNILGHEIHYNCSQTNAGRGKRPEMIITNYSLPDQTG